MQNRESRVLRESVNALHSFILKALQMKNEIRVSIAGGSTIAIEAVGIRDDGEYGNGKTFLVGIDQLPTDLKYDPVFVHVCDRIDTLVELMEQQGGREHCNPAILGALTELQLTKSLFLK